MIPFGSILYPNEGCNEFLSFKTCNVYFNVTDFHTGDLGLLKWFFVSFQQKSGRNNYVRNIVINPLSQIQSVLLNSELPFFFGTAILHFFAVAYDFLNFNINTSLISFQQFCSLNH